MSLTTIVGFSRNPVPVDLEKEKSDEKQIIYYYPTSEQYPVDNVCKKIVSALEKKNWVSPGLNIKFSDDEDGPTTYRTVRTIECRDFRICFGRKQGYNDTAAVDVINIPQKQLKLYSDGSGPLLHVYVGNKWKVDSKKFVCESKASAKLYKEPRIYLNYEGSWQKPGDSSFLQPRGNLKPYFVANNSLGREYSPENDDPTYYLASEVFKEFVSYLKNIVLEDLEKKTYTVSDFFDFNFVYKN